MIPLTLSRMTGPSTVGFLLLTKKTSLFYIFQFLCSVSTCASCVDRACAVELDVQTLIHPDRVDNTNDSNATEEDHYFNNNTKEMEVCSWCAFDNDSSLLMCDDCPRVFCERCIALSHGGFDKGQSIVNQLKSEGGNHWSCPVCKPTSIVNSIREWIGVFQQRTQSNDENCDNDENDESNHNEQDVAKEIHLLLQRLDDAELMKDEAERMLEHESEERIWNEIMKEVETQNLDDAALQDLCQIEFDTWKQQWIDEHTRLSAVIGNIMDSLGKICFLFFFFAIYNQHNAQNND